MAFSIKIYEKDKYMYSLMKARLGALYPEAYITDPYLGNGSDTDGDMFGEFTKILYNPEQFGKEFSQGSVLDEMQSLKECLDNPIPTTGPDGLIDCRNICSALGIKPTRSRDTSGDSKVSGKGRLEVLIPFVYITDRENYIRNNYSDMADADLSLRLDFTSRYRAPEDDGAGILAGNMTGLLEDCVSKRFEPDDILKYCSRNSMGFLTPGAVKNEDDVYDLGSTRCRLLLDKCRDLFEVLDIRDGRRSTVVISQFPVSSWFDMFSDNTYADACLTRITDKHHTYRLEMNGINMREAT